MNTGHLSDLDLRDMAGVPSREPFESIVAPEHTHPVVARLYGRGRNDAVNPWRGAASNKNGQCVHSIPTAERKACKQVTALEACRMLLMIRAGPYCNGMPLRSREEKVCLTPMKLTVAPLLLIGFHFIRCGSLLIRRPLGHLPRGTYDRGVYRHAAGHDGRPGPLF